MNTAKAEDNLIGAFYPQKLAADATSPHGFYSLLGDEGAMPDLDGAIGWLNSDPLSRKSLRGTCTCINSLAAKGVLEDHNEIRFIDQEA